MARKNEKAIDATQLDPVKVGAGIATDAPELVVLAVGPADVPTFVLRADRMAQGHLTALIAGYEALRGTGQAETVRAMESAIREFELWEEQCRH